MPSTPPDRFVAVRGKLDGTSQYANWHVAVSERDRGRCRRCGRGHAQAHHITPIRVLIDAVKREHGITRDVPAEAARLFALCLKDPRFWDVDNGIYLCDDFWPDECHEPADRGLITRVELRRLRDDPRWPRQPDSIMSEPGDAGATAMLRAPLFDGLTERSISVFSGTFEWVEIETVAKGINAQAEALVSIARAMHAETYASKTVPRSLLDQLDAPNRAAVRAAIRRYYAEG